MVIVVTIHNVMRTGFGGAYVCVYVVNIFNPKIIFHSCSAMSPQPHIWFGYESISIAIVPPKRCHCVNVYIHNEIVKKHVCNN